MIDRLLDLFTWPRYRRFLILGKTETEPLWNYSRWLQAAAALDKIMNRASGTASVYVSIYDREWKRDIEFGSLRWEQQDFEKWCFESPKTMTKSQAWKFISTLVFCPSLRECESSSLLPSLFIDVEGKMDVQPYLANWDQLCHVVILESLWRSSTVVVEQVLREMRSIADAALILTMESRLYALSQFDTLLNDFYYPGILESPLPDLRRMKGRWQLVE